MMSKRTFSSFQYYFHVWDHKRSTYMNCKIIAPELYSPLAYNGGIFSFAALLDGPATICKRKQEVMF